MAISNTALSPAPSPAVAAPDLAGNQGQVDAEVRTRSHSQPAETRKAATESSHGDFASHAGDQQVPSKAEASRLNQSPSARPPREYAQSCETGDSIPEKSHQHPDDHLSSAAVSSQAETGPLWMALVNYRSHLEGIEDPAATCVHLFLSYFLRVPLDLETYLHENSDFTLCVLGSNGEIQRIGSVAQLQEALPRSKSPGSERPGGTRSNPPRGLFLACIGGEKSLAALIALLVSRLSIPYTVFAAIVARTDWARTNSRKFGYRGSFGRALARILRETLVLDLDQHVFLVRKEGVTQQPDDSHPVEYLMGFIVPTTMDSAKASFQGKQIYQLIADSAYAALSDWLDAEYPESFYGDEDIHVLGRVWLRLHWELFSTLNIATLPGIRAVHRSTYSRIFESDDLPRIQGGMFELTIGCSRFKRWLHIHSLKKSSGNHPNKQKELFEIERSLALEEAAQFSEALGNFTSIRSLEASLLSIRESKLGIEEAHAITRLTQLAFVFLPLTFVTGVFGMNIKPFGGDAPTWQFWATVAGITLPTFSFGMWTARKDIERLWYKMIAALALTSSSVFRSWWMYFLSRGFHFRWMNDLQYKMGKLGEKWELKGSDQNGDSRSAMSNTGLHEIRRRQG